MTIGALIDFYLSIQQPGNLVGFADLYGDDIESLKASIQNHYGSQEMWSALPEEEDLPVEIAQRAERLIDCYEDWKG